MFEKGSTTFTNLAMSIRWSTACHTPCQPAKPGSPPKRKYIVLSTLSPCFTPRSASCLWQHLRKKERLQLKHTIALYRGSSLIGKWHAKRSKLPHSCKRQMACHIQMMPGRKKISTRVGREGEPKQAMEHTSQGSACFALTFET